MWWGIGVGMVVVYDEVDWVIKIFSVIFVLFYFWWNSFNYNLLFDDGDIKIYNDCEWYFLD